MKLHSARSDGISWIIGRHGRREDISQDLDSSFTPIPPSYSEVLTNEVYAPYDVIDQHERTGDSNRVWLGHWFLPLMFGK